jgi:hypothetical protein
MLMVGSFLRVTAQEQPLPDFDTLWKSMKPYLMGQYDQTEILKGYTYRRHSFVTELGKADTIKKTDEFESEVYHFDQGQFNKVISRNGVPLSEKEIKKQDQEFEKFKTKGPSRGGPPWRGRRRERSPKEQEELLNDVRNTFDFEVLRRELRDGRNTIVVHFKPRKSPSLQTMVAKLFLTKVEGTAWIDELDHRIVKIDADFIKDAKLGLGLVASVGDESDLHREWAKVNDEVWLPSRSEARLKGRLFLAKGINLRLVDEFSEYKKFSVETTIKVTGESP